VFVSSDRDARSFDAYYATMPWAKVPFEAATARATLGSKYAIRGIPALLLFDPAGKLITREGVKLVQANGLSGVLVRAPPRPFPEVMASVGAAGGNVLLYFVPHTGFDAVSSRGSASHPGFDAVLARWSAAHPEARIVCIGRAASATWPVLPPGPDAMALAEACGVGKDLALALVDNTGAILCRNAKVRVETEPERYPWPPQACETLHAVADDINEVPTLVLFLDKLTDADLGSRLEYAFRAAADACWTQTGAPKFAITFTGDEVTDRLRLYAGMARDRDGPSSYRLAYFQLAAGVLNVWKEDRHPDQTSIVQFIVRGAQ
jgi:nucleoredoxin